MKAPKHQHRYKRSKPGATVEVCACGRFRFTEHAGPAIAAVDLLHYNYGGAGQPACGKVTSDGHVCASDAARVTCPRCVEVMAAQGVKIGARPGFTSAGLLPWLFLAAFSLPGALAFLFVAVTGGR